MNLIHYLMHYLNALRPFNLLPFTLWLCNKDVFNVKTPLAVLTIELNVSLSEKSPFVVPILLYVL